MSFELTDYSSAEYTEIYGSSHISQYTYDSYRNSLVIKYTSGSQYLYAGVPESVFLRLQMAQSKGKFVHQYIKQGYPSTKIDNAQN